MTDSLDPSKFVETDAVSDAPCDEAPTLLVTPAEFRTGPEYRTGSPGTLPGPMNPAPPRSAPAAPPPGAAGLRRVEHPLNEAVRGLLRLEHLLQRWQLLVARDEGVDHHHALLCAFEIIEVASRRDLRADLQDELHHQRRHLDSFRGNPAIAEDVLDAAIGRIDDTLDTLRRSPARVESVLTAQDFLIAVRSRAAIAGGLCPFDLPAYTHWQQAPAAQRRADLHRWVSVPLLPLSEALDIGLGLLRESGQRRRVVAHGGLHRHALTAARGAARAPQLARLDVDPRYGLVPEVSANRLQLSIQFARPEADGTLVPEAVDVPFDLTLFG